MIQVITTVDSKTKAKEIASSLVEKRLAACVQILPIESIYRWKGKIETAKEFQLIIKGKNFKALEKAIKEIHPYEVPEIIQIPIKRASKSYLSWLKKETK